MQVVLYDLKAFRIARGSLIAQFLSSGIHLTGEICYPTHNGHCGCAAALECINEKKTEGKGDLKF